MKCKLNKIKRACQGQTQWIIADKHQSKGWSLPLKESTLGSDVPCAGKSKEE